MGTCSANAHSESCLTCKDRHAEWFCNLSPQALTEFDALGMHLAVPTGSTLFLEGQTPRGVSVLCGGHVKLTTSSKEGKTLLVRIAKPGDVLGLSAALSGTRYEVTAQAVDAVKIKSFQSQDFLGFLERHVESGIHAAKTLNAEYRNALSDAVRIAVSASISGRVARLLLQMASEKNDAGNSLTLSLTHEDIASMLGTTRESVTRVLNEMKRNKTIAIKGTSVTILRRDTLECLL